MPQCATFFDAGQAVWPKGNPMSSNSKVIFANQLRGVAALCVVFSHLFYVFWYARDTVANYIGASPIEGDSPNGVGIFVSAYLNTGAFGVAIFFLISGFVIPFSLSKASPVKFLVLRAIRVYPTYIVGLLFVLSVVWVSGKYWGKPFMWDASTILQNMALINSMTETPSVDLVNWTLAIEIKFYIVASLMIFFIRRAVVWPVVVFGAAVLVANKIHQSQLGTELVFVIYMFIGVIFNYRIRGLISKSKLVASILCLGALSALAWKASPWEGSLSAIGINYLYALVVFGGAFVLREVFKENRLLDFFADISFPLYVTHSLLGYSIMRFMLDKGIGLGWVMFVAFFSVICVAYILHLFVEKPTMAAGKKLGVFVRSQPA
ncbi:hypothetical protein PS854_03317 [Pseudomonas fluorescens]|uniref:Acyltransferase 3 domain-containing protein n=2 Tax=Pseudomonas fluorescens TaxID=294 RepID=A0A5E7LGY1_PSEFL|nr:hypothetical protein PS854_03317 [Pseudomonas fluorescens]